MEGGEMKKADIKLLTPSGSHNLLFSVPYFAMWVITTYEMISILLSSPPEVA